MELIFYLPHSILTPLLLSSLIFLSLALSHFGYLSSISIILA
nr:MAG TPA: hypothetical protein [Caudoviricetes sp.]